LRGNAKIEAGKDPPDIRQIPRISQIDQAIRRVKPMTQFDRFTERARKVLLLAQEESARFNHNHVGTEHFLLAIVREGDSVAARVLINMGVQLPKVRSAVEYTIGRGEHSTIGRVGLTARSKKVLELAVDESRRLNHRYIGTEHLLLGLVREGDGIAAGILESLGCNLDSVRAQVLDIMSKTPLAQLPGLRLGATPEIHEFAAMTLAMLGRAIQETALRHQTQTGAAHLFLALAQDENPLVSQVFQDISDQLPGLQTKIIAILSSRPSVANEEVVLSPILLLLLRAAHSQQRRSYRPKIAPEDLLSALAKFGVQIGNYYLNVPGGEEPEARADAQFLVEIEPELTEIQHIITRRVNETTGSAEAADPPQD
jgi:ATP-dependent Clp protease ATP-binding subunit ClpA